MPLRNPFRRAGGVEVLDDSQRGAAERGFQNTAVSGAKPVQIKEPAEYKLSGKSRAAVFARSESMRFGVVRFAPGAYRLIEINGSGVYLPVRHYLFVPSMPTFAGDCRAEIACARAI